MSGVLNRALRGYRRLLERGCILQIAACNSGSQRALDPASQSLARLSPRKMRAEGGGPPFDPRVVHRLPSVGRAGRLYAYPESTQLPPQPGAPRIPGVSRQSRSAYSRPRIARLIWTFLPGPTAAAPHSPWHKQGAAPGHSVVVGSPRSDQSDVIYEIYFLRFEFIDQTVQKSRHFGICFRSHLQRCSLSISYSILCIICRRDLMACFLETSPSNATIASFLSPKSHHGHVNVPNRNCSPRYALTRFRSATYTGPNPEKLPTLSLLSELRVSPYTCDRLDAAAVLPCRMLFTRAVLVLGPGIFRSRKVHPVVSRGSPIRQLAFR